MYNGSGSSAGNRRTVEPERSSPGERSGCRGKAPERRPQTFDQFMRRNRLQKALERVSRDGLVTGEEQNPAIRMHGTDSGGRLDTADFGHQRLAEEDLRLPAMSRINSVLSIENADRIESTADENQPQCLGNHSIVVRNEHLRSAMGRNSHRSAFHGTAEPLRSVLKRLRGCDSMQGEGPSTPHQNLPGERSGNVL